MTLDRVPELRSALEKLDAAPDADEQYVQLSRAEIDALIALYQRTEAMAEPQADLEEVAVLRLPIRVDGMKLLTAGMERVYGARLFLPRWHKHGEGHLVFAREKEEQG